MRRIAILACSGATDVSSASIYPLMTRGGVYLNVDDIQCGRKKGIQYVNSRRLIQLIHEKFKQKVKGKIIYITATAFCQFINNNGLTLLDIPYIVGDFGLTSIYQAIKNKKAIVVAVFASVPILLVIGTNSAWLLASSLNGFGLKLLFNNPDKILTSLIDEPISYKTLESRIPNFKEVVIINTPENKIFMNDWNKPEFECLLPEQVLLNPNCEIKPTEIPRAIDIVAHDLRYDQVVNMQDVTGLENRIQFSDIMDLGKTTEKNIPTKSCSGKTVNFLDKFGDSNPVDEACT
jgi:hypothetical protein